MHPRWLVAPLSLERPPAGDDRPGGHELVDYLAVDAGQTIGVC